MAAASDEGVFEGGGEEAEDVAARDVAAVGPVEGDAFGEADPAADDQADEGAAFGEADALQDLVDHGAAGALDDRARLGIGADAAPQQMSVGGGVLLDVREKRVDAFAELGGGCELGTDGRQALHVLGADPDDLDVEMSLAREVVVEQALRDARGGRDLVDRDGVVRAGVEESSSEVEQLTPPLVDRESSPRSRPHGRGH